MNNAGGTDSAMSVRFSHFLFVDTVSEGFEGFTMQKNKNKTEFPRSVHLFFRVYPRLPRSLRPCFVLCLSSKRGFLCPRTACRISPSSPLIWEPQTLDRQSAHTYRPKCLHLLTKVPTFSGQRVYTLKTIPEPSLQDLSQSSFQAIRHRGDLAKECLSSPF